MRHLSRILLVLALGLGLFCYWGLRTQGGTAAFDEMDGLIPFFGGILGIILGVLGAGLWWLARRR